ncbi:Desmoglein-2 [Manis pentadactyla]|nr:Desmoglein-2 [Manis pentadactyla]
MGNTALLIPPSFLEAALCQALDGKKLRDVQEPTWVGLGYNQMLLSPFYHNQLKITQACPDERAENYVVKEKGR